MPIKLCGHGSCPNPATYRGRCKGHARAREKQTHPNKSVYNSKRWRILRRAVLHDQPLCRCGEIAVDVHHIQGIEHGGATWDRANLEGLCKVCHGRETKREQGR